MRRALGVGVVCLIAGCASLQERIETSPVSDYVMAPASTPACTDAVAQLERVVKIPVSRAALQEGLWGWTNYEQIVIREGLNSCTELEVLAHEAAHLHQPFNLTRREKEIFADVVSIQVAKRLAGYDPTTRYLGYLALSKPDARIATLYKPEIARAVTALTK